MASYREISTFSAHSDNLQCDAHGNFFCPHCGSVLSRVDSYSDSNEYRVEYCCPECHLDVVEEFECIPKGFYFDRKYTALDPEKSTIADLLAFMKAPVGGKEFLDAQAEFLDDFAIGFAAELVEGAVKMSQKLAGK